MPIPNSFLIPVVVSQGLLIAAGAAVFAYRWGIQKATPSALTLWKAELADFFLGRARFLSDLDQEIDGKRYRGVSSALLLHRELELGSCRPIWVPTEGLYRTAEGQNFLLKGEFVAAQENSRFEKLWIEPLTLEQAQHWALRYSNGRNVSHV